NARLAILPIQISFLTLSSTKTQPQQPSTCSSPSSPFSPLPSSSPMSQPLQRQLLNPVSLPFPSIFQAIDTKLVKLSPPLPERFLFPPKLPRQIAEARSLAIPMGYALVVSFVIGSWL